MPAKPNAHTCLSRDGRYLWPLVLLLGGCASFGPSATGAREPTVACPAVALDDGRLYVAYVLDGELVGTAVDVGSSSAAVDSRSIPEEIGQLSSDRIESIELLRGGTLEPGGRGGCAAVTTVWITTKQLP